MRFRPALKRSRVIKIDKCRGSASKKGYGKNAVFLTSSKTLTSLRAGISACKVHTQDVPGTWSKSTCEAFCDYVLATEFCSASAVAFTQKG